MKALIFSPGNDSRLTSVALLLLRLWLGASMFLNHGLGKLSGFSGMKDSFPDPFGVGHATSLALAIFGEVLCSLLLVAGFLTRAAALVLATTMSVAFFAVHGGALKGEQSGELAFIYLAGFMTLVLAGPGRMSADQAVFGARKG